MILVLLGTQKNKFNRLLEAVQFNIDNGTIKDKVVVQAGCSDFKSQDMQLFNLLPMEDLNNLIDKSNLIITHGGVGSIVGALKKNKKIIAMPRLKKYNEHVNDHQKEIISIFTEKNYIKSVNDKYELHDVLLTIDDFTPNNYKSNTDSIIQIIDNFINNN